MADAYAAAAALLDALPASFPARRYVLNSTLAGAAFDCESTVVAVERVFSGLPGAESAGAAVCVRPRSVELVAAVIRCVPTGDARPPTAAQLDQSAQDVLADLDALEAAVRTASADGTLADGFDEVVIGRGFLISPSGGLGGAALSVSVPL